MASKRELLLQRLVSQLDAGGKPAGLTVGRSRTRPHQLEGLPTADVYLRGEEVKPGDGRGPRSYKVIRSAVVRVEVRTVITDPDDDTSPDAALDPLLSWVVRQVMEDRTQGGAAMQTFEMKTQWAAEEGDAVYAAAAVDFQIDYPTAAGDPDA